MAYKFREEIVGKRFLSVSSTQNIKLSKISEWEWRAGIIRAASHSDPKNPELSVLVEYDDLDWKKREWVKIYEDNLFNIYLVEDTLVWASRDDPNSPGHTLEWPAVVFSCLVDKIRLSDKNIKLIEFLGDKKIDFIAKHNQLTAYQSGDLNKHQVCKEYSEVNKAIKAWTEYQDGQRILLTTPSVLVGYRIEVYRSEGTTQWYTAVIISYNDGTKELTVTDDTVLEDHNEDPCLVQMKLIGDGVVESILRGENVGITPRRRSCTTQQNNQHQTRTRSGPNHHISTSHTGNTNKTNTDLHTTFNGKKSRQQPSSRHLTSDLNNSTVKPEVLTNIIKLQSKYRRRTSSENKNFVSSEKLSPKVVIEKCVQKSEVSRQRVKKLVKKSVCKSKRTLKKDHNNKSDKDLPAHVTEHILSAIESVIQNYQPSLGYTEKEDSLSDSNADNSESNASISDKSEDKISEIASGLKTESNLNHKHSEIKSSSDCDNIELEENSNDSLVSPSSFSSNEHLNSLEDSSLCIITNSSSPTPPISSTQDKCNGELESNSVQHSIPSDMECEISPTSLGKQTLKTLSDDRQSDSGISEKLSSRSEGYNRASSDERSISRSSESSRLSDSSDTAISIPVSQSKSISDTKGCADKSELKSKSISPLVFDKSEPVKVWRDPDLLNSSSQSITHISSVQHNSMQHPNSNSPASSNSAVYPALGGHHSAPPPGAAARLSSPHQHSRPGTAPLPVSAQSNSLTSQQLSFHSGLASLPNAPPHPVQQSQFSPYGHPLLPHQASQALLMSQIGNMHPSTVEILSQQQKFNPGAPWSIQQLRDQEYILDRERAMAAEWERTEREKREKQSREKLEKDRKEAELEKQERERERVNREVQQHFEESLLRLANQKKSPGMPTSWNSHHMPQNSKAVSNFSHSNGPKEGLSIKSESGPEVSSRYTVSAMDARYKQELIRKQEEEKLYHSQKQEEMIRHKQISDKNTPELNPSPNYRHPSVNNSSTSASKGQPSFSLYGYQPFQHSYINQDTAHRALIADNKSQGSITSGKPFERTHSAITDRTVSPKPKTSPKPASSFKQYDQLSTSKSSSGLLRIADPHGMNKGVENWQSHPANVEKISAKSKSSHHSLVQQGLVPNPMYARSTPGSPRPAHSTPDHRFGAAVTSPYTPPPAPAPAHMSNSSHRNTGTTHTQPGLLIDNHYKSLPHSGHPLPSVMQMNHSMSSLPQGQPLDLQSTASKRKSQESPEDFSMKKVKQEPVMAKPDSPVPLNKSAPIVPSSVVSSEPVQMESDSPKLIQLAKETREPSVPVTTSILSSVAISTTVSTFVKTETITNNVTNTSTTSNSSNNSNNNTGTSNHVHKLKKAWLQRHSGEDSGATFSVKSEPTQLVSSESSNFNSSAINSFTKKPNKPQGKDVKSSSLVNGHASDASCSSSSEGDVDSGNVNKRKLNSKPKQVGKKSKTQSEDIDLDKSIDSKPPVSPVAADQPKKRGRRPKSKPVEDKKKPVKQEKQAASDTFLQNGSCCEVAPKLPKCRECRMTPHQRNKNLPNIFCRFYEFRKLRHSKNASVSIAGFSEPSQASEEDLKLWLPRGGNLPNDLDVETSKFLLAHVGDQFCDLVEQEREALSIHLCEDKTVTWKRVVQGVREMCDVCETTLFNIHWVCHKCGFVVCIDCYKARKNGTIKEEENPPKDRDGYQWLFCNNKHPHDQSKLMLTQIIAGNALWEIGKLVHEVRKKYNIPAHCRCSSNELENEKAPVNGINKKIIKTVNKTLSPEKTIVNGKKLNGVSNIDVPSYNSDTSSPLSWLADVALTSSGQMSDDREKLSNKESIFDYPNNDSNERTDSDSKSDDNDENFSTLRELLIRPHPGPKSSISNRNSASRKAVSTATTLDDVINCVIEQNYKKGDDGGDLNKEEIQLQHFTRRFPQFRNGREPLPVRVCSLAESTEKYPSLPHSWLCGGRLLRLHNPSHESNLKLFQEQWKRGQPVVVSDVTKLLNKDLWCPQGFSRDYGDVKVDLINCRKGTMIHNQPLSKFWGGFDSFAKRLKDDENGEPAMLKLKDWPPGEDFSEILPTRFSDLMKALPLPMYTHRDGVHNLASHLPECFVKPDLGPKMYNAYGLAKYPDTGTTNLHLDISDAVNVMVYVGIPEDGDDEDHIEKALQVIDNAGCDALTRQRVHDDKEKPGALWHIYNSRDADKIRDLLNKVAIERGEQPEPHHDPIHDQSWYLDKELRNRLYKEYGVEGYTIVQCLGDCVFIPAGAPHQVQNLHSCIKVAEDFVSPENISHCFTLTQEFRYLSDTHTNHEDKLQIKNIIYHAIKDGLAVLLNS